MYTAIALTMACLCASVPPIVEDYVQVRAGSVPTTVDDDLGDTPDQILRAALSEAEAALNDLDFTWQAAALACFALDGVLKQHGNEAAAFAQQITNIFRLRLERLGEVDGVTAADVASQLIAAADGGEHVYADLIDMMLLDHRPIVVSAFVHGIFEQFAGTLQSIHQRIRCIVESPDQCNLPVWIAAGVVDEFGDLPSIGNLNARDEFVMLASIDAILATGNWHGGLHHVAIQASQSQEIAIEAFIVAIQLDEYKGYRERPAFQQRAWIDTVKGFCDGTYASIEPPVQLLAVLAEIASDGGEARATAIEALVSLYKAASATDESKSLAYMYLQIVGAEGAIVAP